MSKDDGYRATYQQTALAFGDRITSVQALFLMANRWVYGKAPRGIVLKCVSVRKSYHLKGSSASLLSIIVGEVCKRNMTTVTRVCMNDNELRILTKVQFQIS